MRLILVPTDFSNQAHNAAIHACNIAKAFNARVLLFHAYMLPAPVSEVPYMMVTVDELQRENENLIKKEAEALNVSFGVEVEWVVRIGIPSDEIKVLTIERPIDLVVMGMKGVGGIDKMIGSTTTNAISKVHKPVLIIPQDARFFPYKAVTFATDLHGNIVPEALSPLKGITEVFNASLHIVHVHKKDESTNTDTSERRRNLENLFQGIQYDFHTVQDASVMHGINSFIEEHAGDLLVMIAHKHTFFDRLFNRSQTRTMAYETRIPLLVLQWN